MPAFNSFMSMAVPQTLVSSDRERIAGQIVTVLKQSAKKLNLKKANCLDIGSSSGEVSSHLCKDFGRIICLDIDKNALDIGRKKFARFKKMEFADFDGVNIPFGDYRFDVIILRKVIECTKYPEKLMEEIFRVLKTGGLIYFESQNIIWPDPNWDWFAFVPLKVKLIFAQIFKKKYYYLATYRNFWQLKKLFKKFHIYMMTPLILKDPTKYNFVRLRILQPVSNILPTFVFNLLEPFNRHFIWILKKL